LFSSLGLKSFSSPTQSFKGYPGIVAIAQKLMEKKTNDISFFCKKNSFLEQ
jgi:hypothetical protein